MSNAYAAGRQARNVFPQELTVGIDAGVDRRIEFLYRVWCASGLAALTAVVKSRVMRRDFVGTNRRQAAFVPWGSSLFLVTGGEFHV